MTARENYSKADNLSAEDSEPLRTKNEDINYSANIDKTNDSLGRDTETKKPSPLQQLNTTRYILSAGVFSLALIVCWLSALFSPAPLNPFADGSKPFTYQWWIEARESNAPLKLPVHAVLNQGAILRLEDDGVIIRQEPDAAEVHFDNTGTFTTRSLTDTANSNSRSRASRNRTVQNRTSAQTTASTEPPETIIEFKPGSTAITSQGQAALDRLILFLELERLPLPETKGYLPLGFDRGDGTAQLTDIILTPYVSAADQKQDRYLGGNMTDTVQRILVKQGKVSPYNIRMQSVANRNGSILTKEANTVRVSFNPPPFLPVQQTQTVPKPPIESDDDNTPNETITLRWQGKSQTLKAQVIESNEHKWRLTETGILQYQDKGSQWQTIAAGHSTMANYFDDPNWDNLAPTHYPSPLAILFTALLTIGGVLLLVIPATAKAASNSTLDDFFISDAPIDSLSSDRLNFEPIALAISKFLRNERTRPPLTAAIVGQWGCGKSSLMKLICNDLSQHQIRPVWVNAWHHQNETQFLAGLLERIRQDALPPTFSAANLIFQFNLLWLRVQKNPLRSLAALALLIIPLGYWMASGEFIVPDAKMLNDADSLSKHGPPWLSALVSFGLAVSLVGTNIANLTGNTWFKKLTGANRKPLDLRSMIGLREQFIGEFEDLCKALHPTTLTVVIDDLDRCNEKRILDILETVNFLVSNGHCYVILGMEEEPVVKAIANYYRNTHRGLSEEELQAKAHRYLEKLINIEVPVPETSAQQSATLATPEAPEKNQQDQTFTTLTLRAMAALICVLSLLAGGIYLGKHVTFGSSSEAQASNKLAEGTGKATINTGQETGIQPPLVPATNVAPAETNAQPTEIATYNPQQPTTQLQWVFLPLILIALLFAYIAFERLRQRQRVVVTDSQQFETSMEKWSRAVGDTRPTPRRIKRFINRTRFLAMRQQQADTSFNEDNLITLAGVYEIHPDLFDSDDILDSRKVLTALQQSCDFEHIEQLKKSIGDICQAPQQEAVNGFKNWVKGIALR